MRRVKRQKKSAKLQMKQTTNSIPNCFNRVLIRQANTWQIDLIRFNKTTFIYKQTKIIHSIY